MRPLESGDPARLGRFELLGEGGQGIVYLGPLRDGDLQRLATGRLAFGGDTVQVVIYRILYEEPDLSSLPPSLLPVIQQCLSKDPRQRPAARDLLLRLVDPSMRARPASMQTVFLGSGPSPYPVEASRAEPLTPTPGRASGSHTPRACRRKPRPQRRPVRQFRLPSLAPGSLSTGQARSTSRRVPGPRRKI